MVEEVPEVWQEGCPFDDDDRPSCDGIQGREGCEALVRWNSGQRAVLEEMSEEGQEVLVC